MSGGVNARGVPSAPVTNRTQVAAALFTLLVGTLVYVLERPGESVPFFSFINMAHLVPSLFGRIGESLPSFSHVFAFSLLTAAWSGRGQRAGLAACLTWFTVDTAFEAGQHPQIAERIVQFIPEWFERLPIIGQTETYFLAGTFDARDLIAIAIGAAAAYLMTLYTTPRHIHHGKQDSTLGRSTVAPTGFSSAHRFGTFEHAGYRRWRWWRRQ